MSTPAYTHHVPIESDREGTTGGGPGIGWAVVALLLGIAVAVLSIVAFGLWADAHDAQKAADAAAAKASAAQPTQDTGHAATGAGAFATPSYAGVMSPDANAIAASHKAYPAELPALTPGPVVKVDLSIRHQVVQIAPGVEYQTWTFGGGVPGPVVHARQGQTVEVTLTNDAPMAHSVDFHAARVAPNKAFVDVPPGKSFTFSFKVKDPGVFMYHCGTKPVLAHIANGMYGAIVVDPADSSLMPPVRHSYVLVSSEWYLNGPGLKQPAGLDMVKAHQMSADWVTWNGYAGQYVAHPLEADPGHATRFYVVAAGPSLSTTFHVVGTILDRAWVDGDVVDPPAHGVQTVTVPAGGSGIFDVDIAKPGLYPFVSHSFASVDMGQVGLLKVGTVQGP
jgi:nitrite reductase (NO-forming)